MEHQGILHLLGPILHSSLIHAILPLTRAIFPRIPFTITQYDINTVYTMYFANIIFHDFGLDWEVCKRLICDFCDISITVNRNILEWKFFCKENKTLVKYTEYTVSVSVSYF